MPALSLGLSDRNRTALHGARISMFNMLLEQDPANEVDGLARLSRPGMIDPELGPLGDGPMRAAALRASSSPEYFFVMGTKFHAGTFQSGIPERGTIDGGTSAASIAVGASHVIIVGSGGPAGVYAYQGTTLSSVLMPDGFSVADAAILNGYTFYARQGSNRVYWADPGEAAPDALNFVSAEYDPDTIVAVKAYGEELWIFGQKFIEIWGMTGDADAPIQRIPGRLIQLGAKSRNAIVILGDMIIWPTNDDRVFAFGGGLREISDNGISELLRRDTSSSSRAWGYRQDGHVCYVLTLGTDETVVADLSMIVGGKPVWSEFGSVGRTGWKAQVGVQSPTRILTGDDLTNDIWQLDPDSHTDDGDSITRTISGGVTVLGKPITNASVEIRCATGQANDLVESDELLFRYSDDEGSTWTEWDTESLGATGRYGGIVTIRRQGIIEAPGRVYEFQYTGDGPFRVSYARIGEAIGSKPRAAT